MSINSGPSTTADRLKSRTHKISLTIESSEHGSFDSQSHVSIPKDLMSCPTGTDESNNCNNIMVDNVRQDKANRKKRRKDADKLVGIKKRAVDLCRKRRFDNEQIKLKLKDVKRIPIVLLNRIIYDPFQPKHEKKAARKNHEKKLEVVKESENLVNVAVADTCSKGDKELTPEENEVEQNELRLETTNKEKKELISEVSKGKKQVTSKVKRKTKKEIKLERSKNKRAGIVGALLETIEILSDSNDEQDKNFSPEISNEKKETKLEKTKNKKETKAEAIVEKKELRSEINKEQKKDLILEKKSKERKELRSKRKEAKAEVILENKVLRSEINKEQKTAATLEAENVDKKVSSEVISNKNMELRSDKIKSNKEAKSEVIFEKKELRSEINKEQKIAATLEAENVDKKVSSDIISDKNMELRSDKIKSKKESKSEVIFEKKELRSETNKEQKKDATFEAGNVSKKVSSEVINYERKELRSDKIKSKKEAKSEVIFEKKELRSENNKEPKKDATLEVENVDKKVSSEGTSNERKEIISDKTKNKKESKSEVIFEKKELRSEANKEQKINEILQLNEGNEIILKSKDNKEAHAEVHDVQKKELRSESKVKKAIKAKINEESQKQITSEVITERLSEIDKHYYDETRVEDLKKDKNVAKQEGIRENKQQMELVIESSVKSWKDRKEEKKKGKRLNLPHKLDPKILHNVCIQVDKKQTEYLIEEFCKVLPRHQKFEVDVTCKEKQNFGDSVLECDTIKCAIQNVNESMSNVSNKCTKKPVVSNSGRVRLTRTTVVDKFNNKCSEDSSKFVTPESLPLSNVRSEVDNQSESSKRFVYTRLRNASIVQNNDKDFASSIETKSNCIEEITENNDKLLSKASLKNGKKYSKNNKVCPEVTCKIEDQLYKNKLISKTVIESSTRPKRTLASRICEKIFDSSIENEKPLDKLRNCTENLKSVTKKADEENNVVPENDVQSVEESSCKGTRKSDKKFVIFKNDIEDGKKKTDDKIEKPNNTHVDSIENSIEFKKISEVVDKNTDVHFNNQTEPVKRSTRNTSDKNMLVEVQNEPKIISSNICLNYSVNRSQIVHNNISKSSDGKVKRISKKSVKLSVEEKFEKINNLNEKDINVSEIFNKSSIPFIKETSKNLFVKLDNKSLENHTQSINEENLKVPQVVLECKRPLRNNIKLNNDKTDSLTNNYLKLVEEQKPNEIKECQKSLKNKVEKVHKLKKKSGTSDSNFDTLTTNVPVNVEPSFDVKEKSDNKLDKDSSMSNENQLDTKKRQTRRMSERKSESEYVIENKLDIVPKKLDSNVKKDFAEKVKIIKRVRRKSLSDKTDKQPTSVTKSGSLEHCNDKDESQQLQNIKDELKKTILHKTRRKVSFQSPEKSDVHLTLKLKEQKESNTLDKEKNQVLTEFLSNESQTQILSKNNLDSESIEDELPNESQKTMNKVQTENKVTSRISSIRKCENLEKSNSEKNIVKSIKSIQNSQKIALITKSVTRSKFENEKQVTKEDKIDDCFKSQVEKRKIQPEKPNGILTKKRPDVLQVPVTVKISEKQHEISQQVVKECSKSQTENNKKVTRKSSSDKHERLDESVDYLQNDAIEKEDKPAEDQKSIEQNAKALIEKRTYNKRFRLLEGESHSYQTRHSTEKKNEILVDDSHQFLKDCVKVQNNVLNKLTKMSTDKNEKGSEYINSILDADDSNVIISERVDNKENSKTLLDNTRMNKSTPQKRGLSKNLAENHVDLTPALHEEKIADSSKLRKTSMNSMNEQSLDNSIENVLSNSLGSIEEFSPEKFEPSSENIVHINCATIRRLNFGNNENLVNIKITDTKENDKQCLDVKTFESRSNTRIQYIEAIDSNDIHIEINTKTVDSDQYFKEITDQLSVLEENENQFEPIEDDSNVTIDPVLSNSDLENLEKEIKAYVITKPGVDDVSESLNTNNTKALEPQESKSISGKSKESLKSFLRNKRITRHSQRSNERSSKNLNFSAISAVDLITAHDFNHDLINANICVNNLSNESVAIIEPFIDNVNDNDIIINKTFTSDTMLCESLAKNTINNCKLSSSKRVGRSRSSSVTENQDILSVQNNISDDLVSSTVAPKSPIINSVILVDEIELNKQKRQSTLQELRKKCTENLQNKKNHQMIDCNNSISEEADEDDEDDSFADSDENLAARLARLNGLEIPPIDNLDSGVQSPSDDQQQRVVDKIVLRCPSGSSFIGLSSELQCKYCDQTFITHRDLKKHTRVQHRQRLIIKITKTSSNERVTHMVEPMANNAEKDSTIDEDDDDDDDDNDDDDDDDDDDEDDEEPPILFNGERSEVQHDDSNGHILDGEIKIIVKKQSDPRNSHIVKEIKITPRTPSDSGNSSCRLPSCSPAKSDLSGGSNSCRYPAYSPAKSDFGQVAAAQPRKRGRPRKYPIFTESELIAKQLASTTTSVIPTVTNGNVFTPFDSESIVVKPDILFHNLQNVVIEQNLVEERTKLTLVKGEQNKIDVSSTQSTTNEPKIGIKRKRSRTLSQSSQGDIAFQELNTIPKLSDEKIVQDNKRLKVCEDATDESLSSNLCEPEFLVKYDIKKELVVKLTKIDTVPIGNTDSDVNVDKSECTDIENTSLFKAVNQIEKCSRGPKPKIIAIEELESKSQILDSVKNKLDGSNIINRVAAEKCLALPSSQTKVQSIVPGAEIENCNAESIIDEIASIDEQTSAVSEETASKILESIAEACGDDDEFLDDNFEPVSELSSITPQTMDKIVQHTSTPQHVIRNNNVNSTELIPSPHTVTANNFHQPMNSIQSPPPLQPIHFQNQSQSINVLPPQQQFCILFIPDALYNPDTPMSKDVAPTATLVNFQPVPDSEIANKPLIFTPTTPSKVTTAHTIPSIANTSVSEDHSRSFICSTCSQVQEMISRLEASHGMTEEYKIKCPYCSNDFQSLFYLEYHLKQEHLKCENEKQCRHSSSLCIPSHETASESEVYITFALKCRSCYDIFSGVMPLNDHVMHKHKTLVRFKPSSHIPAATVSSSAAVAAAVYPAFARRNGGRPALLQSACPSDCVCRIGIRSTDSPLQRQEMIRRCPSAMRRLEKIEPAAYEVYTCTLCNSTFLMKDEVVDHLNKMHEVSCKFPCYICLTSFRTLQLQENHTCSETTFQDLDKLLNIAILPTIGSTTDAAKAVGNKYPEDSWSTDEYSNNIMKQTQTESPRNGTKRKNGAMFEAIHALLKNNEVKKAKIQPSQKLPMAIPSNGTRKRKKHCPKCEKKFSYRKNLLHHVIHEHILPEIGDNDPKTKALELINLWRYSKINPFADPDFTDVFSHHEKTPVDNVAQVINKPKRRGRPPKVRVDVRLPPPLIAPALTPASSTKVSISSQPDTQLVDDITRKLAGRCGRCNNIIRVLNYPGPDGHSNQQSNDGQKNVIKFCETCQNGGPSTRRRSADVQEKIVKMKRPRGRPPLNPLHPRYIPPVVLQKPFSCRKCSETFATVPELKIHKDHVHPKGLDNLLTCEYCDKPFISEGMLEKHKLLHNFVGRLNLSAGQEITGNESSIVMRVGDINTDVQVNNSFTEKTNTSGRRDSSDSCSGESKEPEQRLLNCTFCEEVYTSNVNLKNHLKREHGRRASICQFCNGLLIDTSEVRHMLDYHIVPSKGDRKAEDMGGVLPCTEPTNMEEDVKELVRVLGRHRLQSLMMYHDFEGKCNNAIMRCPICPELFATRESCRFHYVWIHDDSCLLCDESFRSGNSACQHKCNAHTSTASYLWCIQRLVTAIVNTLRLDPGQPSHMLYQMLVTKLEEQERQETESQQINNAMEIVGEQNGPVCHEDSAANTSERCFLEEVVLSEDQIPDAGNMIEVVIGREDSEDDLLSMLNLSPSYENNCEQHNMPKYSEGVMIEGQEDLNQPPEAILSEQSPTLSTPPPVTNNSVPSTPTVVVPTPSVAPSSPVVDNITYDKVSSGVCKYKLDNDEEQLVLVVTDEDMITYKSDIGSLAEKISMTCDSLTLEEINEMLRAYFEMNAGAVT